MAVTKLTTTRDGAPLGVTGSVLPEHDIWAIFRALRDARGVFGLKPGHIQSLQALISFLRPGQGDTVFASNQEICRRIGGIDERTLRRHIDRFVELRLIVRHDSPNGKRYRIRSSTGCSLSFGLSLAPLMTRATEIMALAEIMESKRREQLFLRKQLLGTLAQIHIIEPDNEFLKDAHKKLRRKLAENDYHDLIAQADEQLTEMSTTVNQAIPVDLPANDGQIARHQSMSNKYEKDLKADTPKEHPSPELLATVCKEATIFASEPVKNWQAIEKHAKMLAPMMGISPQVYECAIERVGRETASSVIFILMQLGSNIRNFAAYFHSVTLGRRSSTFKPADILRRLSRIQSV